MVKYEVQLLPPLGADLDYRCGGAAITSAIQTRWLRGGRNWKFTQLEPVVMDAYIPLHPGITDGFLPPSRRDQFGRRLRRTIGNQLVRMLTSCDAVSLLVVGNDLTKAVNLRVKRRLTAASWIGGVSTSPLDLERAPVRIDLLLQPDDELTAWR